MNAETWQQMKRIFQAALNLGPEERASFLAEQCQNDDDLRLQIERLLASHNESDSFLASPAQAFWSESNLADDRVGQRIGPYEIVRQIGHGGMGSVFLAVRADDQYRKQVALKLVKRGMDTDVILRRFMMERQILANLEHPNIARLLDGGSTTDGLPYFVMEYVEGEPITDYCNSRELNVSKRLEIFRTVCAALQHAHQNLVVHRDIKPSNILVTAQGEPKLLDFGIAKLLGPDWSDETGEITASMVRLMTPEYASPEQFRGLHITTATDVYSLGLVLYQLLTGHHPYQLKSRHPEEVAQVVLEQEPEKPSSVASRPLGGADTEAQHAATNSESGSSRANAKSLRGDLDNIILKALRKEPKRRYASVQEFSEDIRRHLDGLPVVASPDTFGYRTAKFIRRNKVAALAVAAIVITLVSATVITAWQARIARRERTRAEQRFNDVRKLANSVVFELHDSIQNLPGSTPARELLVNRALEYLDKLASEGGREPSLQLELAAAYDKIGDIQGGFATSHLGQRQKANESYRKGLLIRESLVSQDPTNVKFRRDLSTSYTKLGQILWTQVEVIGAFDAYAKALEINQKLASELPNDQPTRMELAKSYGNYGYLHAANGRADEGVDSLRKAVSIMEDLVKSDPESTTLQGELALSYDNLAIVLMEMKKEYAEALTLYRKSKEIGEKLLAGDPTNTKLRRGQAVGDFNIASVLTRLGETQTALDSARSAVTVFKSILSADPKNDEFQQAVALAQGLVCELMIKNGEASEAIKLLTESLTQLEKSFAASPTDEIAHYRIALAELNIATGHVALADAEGTAAPQSLIHWREARSWFQKSLEILQVFKDGGKLFGDDLAKYEATVAGVAQCDAAIKRLAGK